MNSLGNVLQDSMKNPTSIPRRMALDTLFVWLCRLTAISSVLILSLLLYTVLSRGLSGLSWSFLTSSPHPDPAKAGLWPALMGPFWTCLACALLTLPIGIGTAIFLEELRPRSRWLRWLHSIVQLNISNLAGVPSVVYGIVGMTAFVTMFGLVAQAKRDGSSNSLFEVGVRYYDQFLTLNDSVLLVPVASGSDQESQPSDGQVAIDMAGRSVKMQVWERSKPRPTDEASLAVTVRSTETPGRIQRQSWYHFSLPFGRSVLSGSLTLMLVILPVVILASQEAFRSVPPSLREAALGMGATPWQAVWNVTLPAAVPGIMTGSILAMSRAIGEAAPIMMISGIIFITRSPSNLMSAFTVLSLQIYDWAGRHEAGFHTISAAAIIVLLVLLLLFNSIAILIRQRFSRPLS